MNEDGTFEMAVFVSELDRILASLAYALHEVKSIFDK